MRRATTPLRLTLGALGAVILIAAGVGAYLSVAPEDRPAQTEQLPEGFPLRLHSAPRALPNVAFEDGAGRKLTLEDFRGKIVLLNVWATWCPPCRKEMPTLDRLQTKLGGPGFEVVALSIDKGGPFVVRTFYDEIGIKALRIYIDQSGEAPSALNANGIPITLLIDRAGRELGRKMGPAEWDRPEIVKLIQGYAEAPAPVQSRNR